MQRPGALAVLGRVTRPRAEEGNVFETCKHIFRIFVFICIAIIIYHPFGGHWINHPSALDGGWDTNKTSASWNTDNWDWGVVDCIYFAMVTSECRTSSRACV